MKPPPRTRTKPNRSLKHESVPRRSRKPAFKWQRVEQRKLLNALRRLGRTGGTLDMDYASLRKYVFTRSISEVQSLVESLKNKVISCASFALRQKRCEEEKVRKPIEVWTHIASTVAGAHEEAICTAFSQMLIVSSTEPCTLRNCDPPQDHRPPTDRPVGRTVPLRPMPCSPVQGDRPGINIVHPFQVFKTPAPTFGPVVRQPNSAILPPQQKHSTTAGTSPAVSSTPQSAATSCQPGAAKIPVAPSTSQQPASQTATPVSGQATSSSSSAAAVKTASVGSSVIQTTQQPLEQHPTTISTTSISNSTSYSPHLPFCSSATSLTRVTAPSIAFSSLATNGCSSSCSVPPLSTSAAAFHAKFGRTSKHATKDSPRMYGLKCVVDFERIYRYLSAIHNPNEECHLTPMESAIVLDLLMSLPEELPKLDCNKLHKHLIQVHQCLSSPADSKTARNMLKDLKDGLCDQTGALIGRDSDTKNSQQNTTLTTDSSEVTESGGKKLQPNKAESQSSRNSNTSSQSVGDADMMGLCPPLLNPFMVPMKLLKLR